MKKQVLLLMTGLLFACSGAFAQQEWKELVVNGDFEGSGFSSFSIKNSQDGSSQDLTADNIVADDNDANNHCAKVTLTITPRSCHFIIKLAEPLTEGDMFKFSMRAKTSSEKDVPIRTENMGNIVVKTGGEWSTFTYEGVVDSDLAGSQAITLSFGPVPRKNDIFYFDDISMKVMDGNAPIEFADAKVKEICVSNWDTNGDGELSYVEASAVGDLGNAFSYNQEITSFNELQYFTNLEVIFENAFHGSSLTSVIIPNSVREIRQYAFQYCYSLTSLTLGNKVEIICDRAFYVCYNLSTLTIPKSVEEIRYLAFSNCSNMTELTISSSVKYISKDAFQGCGGLTSIIVEEGNSFYDSRDNCNAIIQTKDNLLITGCMNTIIPSSVTSIGEGAFLGCSDMTSLTIPSSVTSIADDAFYACSRGLTSIIVEQGNPAYDSRDNCNAIIRTADNKLIIGCVNTVIPNDVTSIGDGAFYVCENLTSLSIPNSVTAIGANAFHGTGWYDNQPDGLVYAGKVAYCYKGEMPENTEIVIKEGTLGIASRAFDLSYYDWRVYGTHNLISVTIPNSVVSIGDGAFCGCHAMTTVNIPEGLTSIGDYVFDSCQSLTTVNIPNSVKTIGRGAFAYCSGLTSVTIPNSVTSIGKDSEDFYSGTFSDCIGLTSVTIPKSVTYIGKYSFRSCVNLTEVISMIQEPFETGMGAFWGGVSEYATLYVPAGTKEKYESTPEWNQFKNIVEMDIAPVEEGQTIDIGNEIDENTNLDGTVVDNVFVNISNGDGGFDPVERCLIVSKPTDDSAINGKDIFGDDFKDNYTGIVFKVNEGKGSIKVEAETQGNMVLKVKIGNSDPIEMELDGKLKVKFPYDVSEETLVYIYGGLSSAGAKAMGARRAPSATDLLKIYGFEIVSDASGIDAIENGQQPDAPVYNLNGQRVNIPGKGIYIKNGRKVLVK